MSSSIRWVAEHVVAPLVVAAVLLLAGWAWSLQEGQWEQGTTIKLHDQRLDAHSQAIVDLKNDMGKRLERLEDKVDRVLERLGERP